MVRRPIRSPVFHTIVARLELTDFSQAKHLNRKWFGKLSVALETICGEFGMNLTDEPATRVVASKIIELAQRGVRDAPTLTEMTLQELKHYLPYALR